MHLSRTIAAQVVDELKPPFDQPRADFVRRLLRERREEYVLGKEAVDENQPKRAEHKHGCLAAAGAGHDLKGHGGRVKNACLLLIVGSRRPPSLGLEPRNRGSNGRDEIDQREQR